MKRFLLSFLLISALTYQAQFPAGGGGGNPNMMKAMKDIKGRVYGKIVDAKTKKPVEYASVVVLWFNKDSLLGGGLTKENGEFNIDNLPPMGSFRLRATQIGYKAYNTKIFIQIPNKLEQDLGDIAFEIDEKALKEVEITAEKNVMTMSIDKRTFNVDKDISVRGGTAADVMKNVPGVTVDADGNAQLRNQNPTIFVDGRPTNLTLQQIPADQIDRIEVITNPSVKYDANATGGILNIVMKKNLKPGYNGMVMAYVGTGDRYGGMTNLNVKEGKWNLSAMYNYNQGINNTLGFTKRTQMDSAQQVAGYFNQDNNTWMRNIFNFGKIGIDYSINNRNTITINQMIMAGRIRSSDHQNFDVLDKNSVEVLNDGKRINDQNAAWQNYNSQILYKKTYPKPGKEITMDMNYNHTDARNAYLFTTYFPNTTTISIPTTYQKNSGTSKADQFVFQLDYGNPLGEIKKLEAGIKSYYKKSVAINTTLRSVNDQANYEKDNVMSNHYAIEDMINAAYINYNNKTFWDISYQAGLRFEQSFYKGTIVDKNQYFSYNYPLNPEDILKSLFPGIYFSKKFKKNQEVQFNLSRKINRPNFFQLMPVIMFADRQNYRIGNPQLKPEFRNISEINYNKTFTKGSYLASLYFRYEEQPITDVAYPDLVDPSVLVNTTVNGKNSIRYGIEHTFKYTIFKNLDMTYNVNVFYIFIKGLIVPTEPEVTAKGYAFNSKAILSYRFPKQLTLQVNGNYESPKILLLGATIPVYSMDISLNKMIGSKWILNATLSDVFNTRRMGTHYETPYYIQDLSRRREMRYVKFTATYLFGKMDASIFKRAKQSRGQGDNQGNQDGLDFGR